VGLVGASGCGKSTLCRALIGLAPVRGGAVRLQGVDLLDLGGRPLRRARRRYSRWSFKTPWPASTR
jgi:peptide/nickel transport system ATP-binding protein